MSDTYESLRGGTRDWASTLFGDHTRLKPALTYWLALLLGLLLAVLAFKFLKHELYVGINERTSPPMLTLWTCLVAVAGIWLSPRMLTPSALIFYRTSSLLVGAYLVTGSVPLPDGTPEEIVNWFSYAPWVALIAAVGSIWRPSLSFVPFALLLIHKGLTAQAWGTAITPTDWAPVVESTSFLLLSSVLVIALRELGTRLTASDPAEVGRGRMQLVDALVIVSIGIHFANYFWSGMEKVMLDGGPFTWLLENRTDVLVDVAHEAGFFTIAYGFPFSGIVHTLATQLLLPINGITLCAQLACVTVFWRRSWIVALTLLYDLQHITIFLLTGIFFWKWIIFNLALVAAVSRIDREKIPLPVGALGLAMCLGAGQLFFVANLGWYDSRAFNHFHVVAVVDDGREVAVPSNFFGPLSVMMAQMDPASSWDGSFPTGTWGTTASHDKMKQAMACNLAADRSAKHDDAAIKAIISRWHGLMLRQVGVRGNVLYDVYPHHIWSDPRRFDQFASLDLRHVTGYRLVRESKCLDGSGEFGGPQLVSRVETLVPTAGEAAAGREAVPQVNTGSTN